MRTISFQLYSAHRAGPIERVIPRLAGYGYRAVEGYGDLYDEPSWLADLLAANGLTMPSGHFGLDRLADPEAVARTAHRLGIADVICPNVAPQMRRQPSAAWRSFARELSRIGGELRSAGLRFGWHNNDFEFLPMEGGDLPMRILLEEAPDLDWQFDVLWAIKGGSDPVLWYERYGPRIFSLHVKDEGPAGSNPAEGDWADVGHGTVDWPGLVALAEAKTAATLFVLEHEQTEDVDRFAVRSLAAASAWP